MLKSAWLLLQCNDRIDNCKLHTADSCQLVCFAVQLGRGAASVDDVFKHLSTIKLRNSDMDPKISDSDDEAIEETIEQLHV